MGPGVLEPMLPEPVPELLPEEEPDDPIEPVDPDVPVEEPDESLEGLDMGAGAGTVPVSPTFLPQALNIRPAASVAAMSAAVLTLDLNMRIP